jgi:hypothetical protein
MARKTYKRSRRGRRKTLRRYRKKRGGALDLPQGGRDSQSIVIPTSAFRGSDMVNSADVMGGIAKL